MALRTIDLGPVSSYAIAVEKGYTGTEAEWYELIHNVTSNAEAAASSASSAAQSAATAVQAVADVGTAKDAAIAAIQGEGNTQTAAVTAEGAAQIANVQAAEESAVDAVEAQQGTSEQAVYDKGVEQIAAVGTAGTTQIGLVQAEGATQIAAVEAKGEEVIESIPEDYSDLTDEVGSLKSAFENVTGNTRNLIQGILRRCSIESSGAISGSQNNYDLYYAPVTSGKTYHVTTNDSANLVCAFYASVPAVGSTPSYGTRTVQTNKSITAPTTGYIAFRTMADYQYAQIEEGTIGSAYIKPHTAEDLVARENLSNNNAIIKNVFDDSRDIINLLSFDKWEVGNITSDGVDGDNTDTLFPCTIRTVGYYKVTVGSVLVKPNGFYVGIIKYNESTYAKISTKFWITSDEVFPFEDGYVYRIVICDATNSTAASYEWINAVRFEYDNEYKVRNISSSLTSLATLLSPGSYNISSDVFDNLTDAPSDATHNIYNLYVNSKAWAGSFTLQRLECYDGKIWERTLTTATGAVTFDWKRVDPEYIFNQHALGNYLNGKKLVTAGDSYTAAVFTGDYAEYNSKNFGYYIAQRNNMTFVNSGINGSTMAVSNTEDPTEKSPFSYQRYLNVPEDTDYLTLWFGINDSAYSTLGTIDDTENTTFYGAWNKVLEYYLTNRPFMKILIIVTTIGVGSTENAEAFKQAVRDVATKWGYPILDWNKEETIPAFFEKEGMSNEAQALRKNAFGWNGPVNGHPNPQWHEYESTIIENALRSI